MTTTQDLSRQAGPTGSRARIAISTAFFVNGFGMGSWTPEVPIIGARLGLTEATYGFMILVFGLGAVMAMPFVGAMIARAGSRPVVIATQLAFAAAFPLLTLAPHPIAIGAALFLFGIGLGGLDVAMNANAVSVERRLDRSIMSSCHGFWSLGAFAGAGIGGSLIDLFGPGGHTSLVGLFCAGILLAMLPALLDDRALASETQAAQDGTRESWRSILSRKRKPLLLSLVIGVIALAGFMQEGVVIDWSAVYLRSELGVSVAASGFGFAAFSVSMATLRFLGDGIRDRLGAVRTVRLSLLFALTGAILLAVASNLAMALAGYLVLGIGLANLVPIAFSAAGNIKGLANGTGISIASAIAYSGGLIAPSIVGLVASAYGFSTIYLALAVIISAVFLSAGLLKGADRESGGH